MKLKKIETFCTVDVGFVRVTSEDGATGWGQVSTYNADITSQVLHRQVAPWTLGVDTTDLDDLLDLVTEREHKFPGSYLRRAMAGLDTAIWDLRGKQAGVPVTSLIGGSPGRQSNQNRNGGISIPAAVIRGLGVASPHTAKAPNTVQSAVDVLEMASTLM